MFNESTEQLLDEAILTTYSHKSLLSHKAVYFFSELPQKKIQSMFIRLLSMLTNQHVSIVTICEFDQTDPLLFVGTTFSEIKLLLLLWTSRHNQHKE